MSLRVTDPEHLAAVRAFADARGLREQLEDKLTWLEKFRDGTCECVLYPDFSNHSFYWELFAPGTKERMMNGGLLWYEYGDTGVGSPQFSVRLNASKSGWEIHT